jgi:DNA-binding NarL/FixJ family response regulator
VRVAIAEDSLLFREGLARILREAGFDVVAEVGEADALLEAVDLEQPDVAIVDVRMPPAFTDEGLVAAAKIRSADPSVGVVVLSHHVETEQAVRLLGSGSGGIGYLLKDRVTDLPAFFDAVRRVGMGGSAIDPEVVTRLVDRRRGPGALESLTEREREVLKLMAEGRSNQAIERHMFLSAKTVETHVRSIFVKLDLLPAPADNRRVLAVLTYLRG